MSAVVQSPVAQAGAALAAAVVALGVVFDVDVDPEQVASYAVALVTALAYIYRRVSPVPKDDRGFSSVGVEDTTDLLARRIREIQERS